MKIAVISSSRIPSLTANSIQILKRCQAFAQLGHQVSLWVVRSSEAISWEEINQHYGLSTKFEIRWLSAYSRLRGYDFALRARGQAKRWGAQVIFTRMPQAAAFASLLGDKTIFETHDLPQGVFGPYLFRKFYGGRGAQKLVSISNALEKDLQMIYQLPANAGFSIIAPDGVDLERYENLPSPEEARRSLELPQQFTVGYTGHLYPGRGVGLILELAAKLPKIHFMLVGGRAADVQKIKARLQEKGLKNVSLIGFVPNAELPSYQAACEVLLMPYQSHVSASSGGDISRYLSPMKMFEYLASRRVILASDLPVLQEVLNDDNAVLLPASDPDLWAETLEGLQADPPKMKRLAENAYLTAQGCSWKERAKQILEGVAQRA